MKNIYKILIFIVVMVILFSGIFFFYYKFKTSKISQIPVQQNTQLGAVYNAQKGKEDGTMYQNINNEIAAYKADIASSTGNQLDSVILSKKIYLYRSLATYGEGVESQDGNKTETLQGFDGLYSVYNSVDYVSKKENKDLRYIRLTVLKNLFDVFSTTPLNYLVASSSWVTDPEYQLYISKFGKSPKLAFRAYFDNLISKNNIYTDKMLVSIEMSNKADILNSYSSSISADYKNSLVRSLDILKTKYASAQPSKLFTNIKVEREINPAYNYSYALGILSLNSKYIKSEEVSKSYYKLFDLMDKSASSGDDLIFVKKVKAQIYFIDYLYVVNKNKLTPEISAQLTEIQNFPKTYKSNPIFLNLFASIIQSRLKNDMNFVGITKKDKLFGDFTAEYAGK